ncbi:hypothetical protein IT417_00205 [bacterium]|nr:hypothetical protein [bacterium]
MNFEKMKKQKNFETYIETLKRTLLSSSIPFHEISYEDFFIEQSNKEAKCQIDDPEGKYANVIAQPQSGSIFYNNLVRDRRGDLSHYYDSMVKKGYLDPSFSFDDYLRISQGKEPREGDAELGKIASSASMRYEKEIKDVTPEQMRAYLLRRKTELLYTDCLKYLWRGCQRSV